MSIQNPWVCRNLKPRIVFIRSYRIVTYFLFAFLASIDDNFITVQSMDRCGRRTSRFDRSPWDGKERKTDLRVGNELTRGPFDGAPTMQPKQLASARAHELLAELISLGVHLDGPITCAAKCEDRNLQVVVTISDFTPMKIQGERPCPTTQSLPPLHKRIVELLDTKTPRKGEWIAAKLHRAYSGSFRSALADLVAFEVTRKVEGEGYLLR